MAATKFPSRSAASARFAFTSASETREKKRGLAADRDMIGAPQIKMSSAHLGAQISPPAQVCPSHLKGLKGRVHHGSRVLEIC